MALIIGHLTKNGFYEYVITMTDLGRNDAGQYLSLYEFNGRKLVTVFTPKDDHHIVRERVAEEYRQIKTAWRMDVSGYKQIAFVGGDGKPKLFSN